MFFALFGLIIGIPYVISMLYTASESASGQPADGVVLGFGSFFTLVFLATIIPSIAVTVRRLHDANLSGLFYLLVLAYPIGGLAILIMTILPSNPEGRRFDKTTLMADSAGSQYR